MKHISLFLFFFVFFCISSQDYYESPEFWQDLNIYFIVTDRFNNGDKNNDNFDKGEYNPLDIDYYHGGDFKGLIEKLDYLEKMAVKAIWITPQIFNQWISPPYGKNRYSGYHGYWAYDFYQIDPHLGTLEDYKNLVKECHKRGIYVIQDIVCNHMGDFISEDSKNENIGGYPEKAAKPFDDKKYFHFNGKTIYETGFGGTLDDLRTEDPYVKDELIKIFKYWIKEADIDGYRIDTVKYVNFDFWVDFCREIRSYANSLGKKNFIIFGENYEYDYVKNYKYSDAEASQGRYTGTDQNPIFNSMLDFSFTGIVTSVIAGTSIAGPLINDKPQYGSFNLIVEKYSNENFLEYYTDESRNQLVTFIDNHDMTRFLHTSKANSNINKLKLALILLYTLPGLPCLYYGTEQAFDQPWGKKGKSVGTNNRQDMWDSKFDTNNKLFKFTQNLIKLRNNEKSLQRGIFKNYIVDDENGLFVFQRDYLNPNNENEIIYIALNRNNKTQTVTIENKKYTILKEGFIIVKNNKIIYK